MTPEELNQKIAELILENMDLQDLNAELLDVVVNFVSHDIGSTSNAVVQIRAEARRVIAKAEALK